MNFTRRCRVLPPPDKWREHEIHSDCSASCHAFFVPRVILVIYLYTIHFHFEQSLAHRQPLFLWTGQQNNKSAELYFRYLLGCAVRWWCKTLGLVHGSAGWDLGLGSVRRSNQGQGHWLEVSRYRYFAVIFTMITKPLSSVCTSTRNFSKFCAPWILLQCWYWLSSSLVQTWRVWVWTQIADIGFREAECVNV